MRFPSFLPVAACVVAIATGPLGHAQSAPAPAAVPSGLAQSLLTQLRTRLDSMASHTDGVVGYAVLDLTARTMPIARLDQAVFPTASTIKLAILDEMFRQADAGTLDLDTPRAIPRTAVVGGSGVLQHLTAPTLPLRDVATLMMIVSDNTATNLLIDAVGMENVNARSAALGVADVRLRRKMIDAAAARRGDENVATPRGLATLAAQLWAGDGLTTASRDAARRMLYAVPGRMRDAVPGTVRVALKTGSLEGVRAEAAVVELPGQPYALAIMTTYLANDAQGEAVIEAIAGEVYRTMARLANGGAYGRKMP